MAPASNIIKDATGVVLAGGENTRMPVLKAFIKVKGIPIINRNLGIYQEIFNKTVIVTNEPERYSGLRTPMLGDIYDIRGPMTGIFTVLLNSSTKWIFVSACDMPFISKELIIHIAKQRKGHDAVMPRIKSRPEPLFAFYSRNLLPSIEKSLQNGNKGLRDFLKHKKVKYISLNEINKVEKGVRSFINLNTPEDLKLYL